MFPARPRKNRILDSPKCPGTDTASCGRRHHAPQPKRPAAGGRAVHRESLSPGLKSDILSGNTRPAGRNLPLHRISCSRAHLEKGTGIPVFFRRAGLFYIKRMQIASVFQKKYKLFSSRSSRVPTGFARCSKGRPFPHGGASFRPEAWYGPGCFSDAGCYFEYRTYRF